MAKIDFDDKENVKNDPFIIRKFWVIAEDLNEIKHSVNTLYDEKQDSIIVLTQTEYNALNPVDESKFYFIVG